MGTDTNSSGGSSLTQQVVVGVLVGLIVAAVVKEAK